MGNTVLYKYLQLYYNKYLIAFTNYGLPIYLSVIGAAYHNHPKRMIEINKHIIYIFLLVKIQLGNNVLGRSIEIRIFFVIFASTKFLFEIIVWRRKFRTNNDKIIFSLFFTYS